MKILSLNGEWTLSIPTKFSSSVPATVPGSVYADLLRQDLIPDPFYGANEEKVLPLMDEDFIYEKDFVVDGNLLNSTRILLRAEGIDTLSEITVNGQLIGKTNNMHRTYEFDVTDLLKEGENHLQVYISSPTRFIKEAYKESRADGSSDAMTGFPLLRKAHCMFGWDWGPHLPDAGIWRNISLLGIEQGRIRDVYIHQEHEDGKVTLNIKTNTESYGDADTDDFEVENRIIAPNGTEYVSSGDLSEITINDPELWWPNGFGKQPLYKVQTILTHEGKEIDRIEKRIGLRTMTISRKKDEYGESFCHCVNGVEIFAMGADYIPEDNLISRVTPERTRRLLTDARDAHMNAVRVWGGGYYPDDFFYDICDELGLMVWQDFMFACAVYNLTEDFEENIRAEIIDNVRRLRHHASLGLWCGNNEMEMFVAQRAWVSSDKQVSDYVKMYEYIFPKILKEEDPDTFYWPASPSSGGAFDDPNDENRGDVHYWEVWHGLRPFTDYRKYYFRYASEFGFQSFPCMETIRSFAEEKDLNPYSYVMEKHQRNASANGIISSYMSQTYRYPTSFDAFVYTSQLLQAQAIQYGVEHWRRNRGRCMGAIVWQLNDIWPVTSWASIDYFGRWKALHYAEKRFFAPILISCEEEGTLTQNTNVNAEPFELKKTARLNVTNETTKDFVGMAVWALRRADGSVICEGNFPVVCPALSAVWLDKLDFKDADMHENYFSYELLTDDAETVSAGTVLFCAPKHFNFRDPHLTVVKEGDEIIVKADAYARSVEIQAGADVVLSDNFFDMNPSEKRVKVLRGDVKEDLSVRSVFDI